MTPKEHRNIDFTIDFLITDAKVRLNFERLRSGKPEQGKKEIISFLPLAAAGTKAQEKIEINSQDHNFKATYLVGENLYCDIQAQGYAAIEVVKNKQLQLCFKQQFFFLANFNKHGFARVKLPSQTPDSHNWWQLPFNIVL